jgi:arylformamidase
VVAYGANELPEFQRQSIDFHAAWRKVGLDVHLLTLPGRHHHASLEEFYEPAGLLTRQLLAMRDELQ